jgi:hypothetical protein
MDPFPSWDAESLYAGQKDRAIYEARVFIN